MTIQTATKYLKIFFKNTHEDWIAIEDIFQSAGRGSELPHKNKMWFGNKMTYLKRHNLLVPTYGKRGIATIVTGAKLTDEGRRVLGRPLTATTPNEQPPPPSSLPREWVDNSTQPIKGSSDESLYKVMKAMTRLSEENPNTKITYNVKEEVISVQQMRG